MKKTIIAGTIMGSLLFSGNAFAAGYTVKSGDTLWSISNQNHVTVSQLMDWNKITNDIIYPGENLIVSQTANTYSVQSGDTLSGIAKGRNTTVTELLSLNPEITNPDTLSIGQVINLPMQATSSIVTTATSTSQYILKTGDTLSAVAKQFGLTLTQLLQLNPQIQDANVVKVGQVINVSGVATTAPATTPSTTSATSTQGTTQSTVTQQPVPQPTTTVTTVAPTTSATSTTSSWQTKADAIIATAKKYLGTPYLYGSSPSTTATFDCSSFTQHVYGENGITLPRTSSQQAIVGVQIPLSQVREGDLLFFDTDFDGIINHVGIALDNYNMINAATSKGVSYAQLSQYYWGPRFVKAMRVIQ